MHKLKDSRSLTFVGVFGIVNILLTMYVCYLFTLEVPNAFTIATTIIAVLSMWMIYVGVYIGLNILAKLENGSK